MVAQTRHGGQSSPSKKKLAFNEKLVGKGLSTDALLKKLQSLHQQLSALDQEFVDVSSLGTVRKDLVSTSILLHKDRGVKAHAACCLAEILRLYAPDAPYTQPELRDIFSFFFRQLTNGLKGADSAYYNEYFSLLEALSTVKSVVLICDLPSSDELMTEVFRDLFALVRRDLSKKIEMFMADILIALIDECQVLPSDVLEIILAQFMDKNTRMEQPAYRLAVQVCNSTADKLQRHVCQYFTDTIVANSREEEFNEIRTAHDLVKRLHHSCPGLLHSVIPQLEEELRVEDITLRSIATQVLGEMFADKGGQDLVKKYPSTWNHWLLRKNDKSAVIRLKFVETAAGLLSALPEMRTIVEDALRLKLLDPDEKVRAAVCKTYAQLDYEVALHHVDETVLRSIAGRGADKKHSVRVEALNALGKLYSLAYPQIENNEPTAIRQFAWIPNLLLPLIAIGSDVRAAVEQVVWDYIFPLPSPSSVSTSTGKGGDVVDEAAWTDRVLNTMKHIDDEKAINALFVLSGLKNNRPTMYEQFVDACVANNGGVIDENEEVVTRRLDAITNHLAGTWPDPQKANEDFHAFAKMNESRLYKLLKTCIDPQCDLKSLVKSSAEFEKRIEQASASVAPTMISFLHRSSLRIVNTSSIPTLLKRLQKAAGKTTTGQLSGTVVHAGTLLNYISKHCPALFKPHVGELGKAMGVENNSILVGYCLQALSAVVRWDHSLAPTERKIAEQLTKLALSEDARHAKFAGQLCAFLRNKESICNGLVETAADELDSNSSELLTARLALLAQIVRFAPDAFELKSDVIVTYLLKQVLMVRCPRDSADDDEEWALDEEVSESLRSRILVIKICRNRSLAHASSEKALDIAKPVLKMLVTLLEQNGSFYPDEEEDLKVLSRIRLQAAVSLLHLSTVDVYAAALLPKFTKLAIVVQDACYQVRSLFLLKLIVLLQRRKIPPRYNVIPFMTVHDPELDVKQMASSYIRSAIHRLAPTTRVEHVEMMFIRLLHLLAHHPDFAIAHDEFIDTAKYINFYLDLVATSDTVSLLYHLSMKGKTVRDSEGHDFSENFYVICEMAQELIKTRAHQNNWTIQSYPGKVRLPSDVLRPLPNAEAATKLVKTVFLPEEAMAWLAELAPAAKEREKKERKPPAVTTGKRKAPSKSNGNAKRRSGAKKSWRSDEEEDDEEEEEEEEEEESDVEMAAPPVEAKSESEDEQSDEEGGEEKLGRGARTRAKARARRQSKRASTASNKKAKISSPAPSDE